MHVPSLTVDIQVFFTIRLISPQSELSIQHTPIEDPDQLMASEMMDGRDTFLTRAREEHWEFSSLRRAKYVSFTSFSLHYNLTGIPLWLSVMPCTRLTPVRTPCTATSATTLTPSTTATHAKTTTYVMPATRLLNTNILWNRSSNSSSPLKEMLLVVLVTKASRYALFLTFFQYTCLPEMHPVVGPCLPVQRCQLSPNVVSQDEESCSTHEDVQETCQCQLPCLQTTYRLMLLPCQTLLTGSMLCKFTFSSFLSNYFVTGSVLHEHQTEVG